MNTGTRKTDPKGDSHASAPTSRAPRKTGAPTATQAQEPPDTGAILESIGEVVYDWNMIDDRLLWGANAGRVLGVADAGQLASGRAYSEIVAPVSAVSRLEAILADAEKGDNAAHAYRIRYALAPAPRSRPLEVEDCGRWFAGPDGRPMRAHGLVRVVAEAGAEARGAGDRARSDPLTGCLSRSQLIDAVQAMLARSRPRPFCVLLAGLDNLFALNRTYGYDVADEAIAAMASRLKAHMRGSDLIARYSGNKFAVVLDDCAEEAMSFAAERFLEAANGAPYETTAGAIPATLRIGGVGASNGGRTTTRLFQNAEEALDLARLASDKRFVAFRSSLLRQDSRLRAARVADEIVRALNDRRIAIAIQPIVGAASRRLVFGEALLRLRRPDGSLLSPGAILPVAEQAGMVHLLDQRVLELTVDALARRPDLTLSVNVSGATIRDPEWPARLNALLTAEPDAARRLIVEITETCATAGVEQTREAMAAIRSLGARVAMDDFGAGHTSFRNLRALDFDLIKIDGAFMQNLTRDSDDRFFVRTLISLARELKTPIVAEWVETAEAADLLTEWGVDYLQGDLFGRAGDLDVIADTAA